MSVALAGTAPAVAQSQALDPRTRLLLQRSIVPTLLRLAWPNIMVMLALASTGLIATWWARATALNECTSMNGVLAVI
jgi:hypothetical protein